MKFDIDYQTIAFLAIGALCWVYLCWISTRPPKAVRLKSRYFDK